MRPPGDPPDRGGPSRVELPAGYFVTGRCADESVALVHVEHDLTYRVGEPVSETARSRGSRAHGTLT